MGTDADVVIVGAGLAGLSAARHLHRAQVPTMVCEAADDIGGRVRTDRVDGFLLDRGFQVLLPAYPELHRQADIGALRPRALLRGVLAMTSAGRSWLAAPWHGPQALAGSARFLLGHRRDSAAIAALSLRDALAPGSVLSAAAPAATTIEDLRGRFSPTVITEVFRPFLAGVFLDPSLSTPARLFHLIWRCFVRGGGVLPEGGMQQLPRQLAAGLPADTVRTGTPVTEVTESGVRTGAGEHIRARAVVIATDGQYFPSGRAARPACRRRLPRRPCTGREEPALQGDEFDVDVRSLGKRTQIAGIRSENVIAVPGQAYHRSINCIGQAAAGQQYAHPPPQAFIQRSDVHPRQ